MEVNELIKNMLKVLFICHGRTCGPADKASIYATFKTLL